jgi:hypothetical protein
MHRDKRFYRSSGEDMELIKDLPAGALQNAVFYDGVNMKKQGLFSQKGLGIYASDPGAINIVVKHLMAYVHLHLRNGGDYLIRNPVFDEAKHGNIIPPASVFFVPREYFDHDHSGDSESSEKAHHLIEIKGSISKSYFKKPFVEILAHVPVHSAKNEEFERLEDLLEKYSKILNHRIENERQKKESERPREYWEFLSSGNFDCTLLR